MKVVIVEGLIWKLALALSHIGTGKIDATFKKRFEAYRNKIDAF